MSPKALFFIICFIVLIIVICFTDFDDEATPEDKELFKNCIGTPNCKTVCIAILIGSFCFYVNFTLGVLFTLFTFMFFHIGIIATGICSFYGSVFIQAWNPFDLE